MLHPGPMQKRVVHDVWNGNMAAIRARVFCGAVSRL